MKKKELEKLLYETVAEALGVEIADRDDTHTHAATKRSETRATEAHREAA